MKKFAIVFAVIICLTLVLCACGNKTETTGNSKQSKQEGNGKIDSTQSEQMNSGDTEGSYQILMLMGSEVTEGKFTYKFSVNDSNGASVTDASIIKADVEIKNKNGVVVYTGSPKVNKESSSFSVEVLTSEMNKSNHNVGTATVTVSAGSTTKTGTSEMYKLPYDFADITLPEVGNGYVNKGSSGDMRVTYDITEISFGDEEDISYSKDSITFKINLTGKITARGESYKTAKTPSIDIIGYSSDGKTELFTRPVSCTAGENDSFTGTVSIRDYVPGTVVRLAIKQS